MIQRLVDLPSIACASGPSYTWTLRDPWFCQGFKRRIISIRSVSLVGETEIRSLDPGDSLCGLPNLPYGWPLKNPKI